MQTSAGSSYQSAYAAWQADPESYWAAAAKLIDWDRAPDRIFDPASGPYGRWFPDARLNTCHNAVDRHVAAGRGAQPAIIWDSPMTGRIETLTYAALLGRVSKLAGALAARGVAAGDRVVLYMPMVPEAAIGMLACARLGAVHSVVFGGFAAAELAARIADAKPKVILAASCGLEPGRVVAYKPLLDAAIALSPHKPDAVLVLQRRTGGGHAGRRPRRGLAGSRSGRGPGACVPVAATDPLYILYTSGTTGKPKGVVRDNGGHAVALRNSMAMLYGIEPGEVMFTASDVGWVVGHSYIVYAPLLTGATTVLFEGKPVGTPDAGTFWRVCAQHGVKAMFTAPTAIRAIKRDDPDGRLLAQYDLSKLEALFLAGERCDPPTAEWSAALLHKPVIDHWWQTETGWAITGNFRGLGLFPARFGSGGKPSPGYDVAALDEAGHRLPPGEIGTLAIKLPLPPGCLPTLWQADDRFRAAYLETFPGWYNTSRRRGGGCGRLCLRHVPHRRHHQRRRPPAEHRRDGGGAGGPSGCRRMRRGRHQGQPEGPGAAWPRRAESRRRPRPRRRSARSWSAWCATGSAPSRPSRTPGWSTRLPKTRSGKILRATLRKIADGEDYIVPPTIDDASILGDLEGTLRGIVR